MSFTRSPSEEKPLLGVANTGLIVFLGYSLLSYPFYVKYAAYTAYQVGFVILLIGILLAVALRPRIARAGASLFRKPVVSVVVAAYVLYIVFLGIASVLNAGEGYLVTEMGRVVIKVGLGALFLVYLGPAVHRWLLDRYSDVMLVAAVAGIMLVIGVYLGWFAPLGAIQLPSAGLRDDGLREIYLLGFGWGSLPIPGGSGDLIRLQSFSDEPGTFAFALLVGLIWAAHRRRRGHVVAMAVALLLTWSVGAVVGAVVALAVATGRRAAWQGVITILTVALLLGVAVRYMPSTWADVVDAYLQTKVGVSQGSSVGDRLSDISATLAVVQRHPLGLGGGGVSRTIGVSLGVGWLRPLAEAGLLGFGAYMVALGTVTWLAARAALFDRGDVAALGAIVTVLAFAALQRARMDESIWHSWLLAAFVDAYVGEEEARRKYDTSPGQQGLS